MATHLVLDPSKKIANRIEWDGVQFIVLPPGYTTVLGDGQIGWTWNGTEAVNPNPVAPVVAPPESAPLVSPRVLSVSKQILGGREVEFAHFQIVGAKIPLHSHADGHFSLLVNGRVRCYVPGAADVVLGEVGQSLYFPAGVEHEIVAEMDDSVCLQVHDAARIA
jgi:quercetin dioxygenase-like cupin family protein